VQRSRIFVGDIRRKQILAEKICAQGDLASQMIK
jgi:hypothetical protein